MEASNGGGADFSTPTPNQIADGGDGQRWVTSAQLDAIGTLGGDTDFALELTYEAAEAYIEELGGLPTPTPIQIATADDLAWIKYLKGDVEFAMELAQKNVDGYIRELEQSFGIDDFFLVPSPNPNSPTHDPNFKRQKGRQIGSIDSKAKLIRWAVLDHLEPAYDVMTVRQAYYQLVSMGHVPKDEDAGYSPVQIQIAEMRERGFLSWDFIADGSRMTRFTTLYSSMNDFLEDIATAYRRDLWREQGVRIEIWLEKDALAEVVFRMTDKWRVPLMVSRGHSSKTFLRSAAMEAKRAYEKYGFATYVYALYDHDLYGVEMGETIEKRFPQYAKGVPIYFERLALNQQQIVDWDVPTRPPKQKKPGDKKEPRELTSPKWRNPDGTLRPIAELDALPPNDLMAIVESAVKRHVNQEAWDYWMAQESEERDFFRSNILFNRDARIPDDQYEEESDSDTTDE